MRIVSTLKQQLELEIKKFIPQITGYAYGLFKEHYCGQQIIILFKE
jgi:hypothetical protein